MSDRNNTRFVAQICQWYSSRYTVTDACCSTCWRRYLAVFINIIALNHYFNFIMESVHTVYCWRRDKPRHKDRPPQRWFSNQCMYFSRAHTQTGIWTSQHHPQSGSGTTLLLQNEKICTDVPNRKRSMHACTTGPPQQWLSWAWWYINIPT